VLVVGHELVERVAVGPVHVLAVWADRRDDGDRLVALGPEDVGDDDGAVTGGDRDVAIDLHGFLL
jgi:hypothetical protein